MEEEEPDFPAQGSEASNARLVADFIQKKHATALAASNERCGSLGVECCFFGMLLPLSTLCPSLAFAGGIAGFVMVEEFNRTLISGYLDWKKIHRYHDIDPLAGFESYYVAKKRFIPESLWVPIELKFSMARNNPFAQVETAKYLDIALNLPAQTDPIGRSPSESDWLEKELRPRAEKIEAFFANYVEGEKRDRIIRVFQEAT